MSEMLKQILHGIELIRAQLKMLKQKHRDLCIVAETFRAEASVAASEEAKKAKESDAKAKSDEEALCQAERLALREKLSQERDRFRKEANRVIDASTNVVVINEVQAALESLSLPQRRAKHKAYWVAARESKRISARAHKLAKSRHHHTKKRRVA